MEEEERETRVQDGGRWKQEEPIETRGLSSKFSRSQIVLKAKRYVPLSWSVNKMTLWWCAQKVQTRGIKFWFNATNSWRQITQSQDSHKAIYAPTNWLGCQSMYLCEPCHWIQMETFSAEIDTKNLGNLV